MKKINRILVLALLGGATLFTSCVSEEISPEVEKLRQAQVSYLQAQAAMEQAQAEAAAVQTALLQLELEYKQAVQASEIEATVADIEAQVKEAQQKAADAQLALQQAIDNLSGHLNDMAADYLNAYKSATGEADAKLIEILQQEGKIARFKAYLDVDGNPLDFELMAEAIQRDLAQDSANYKAAEASMATLKSVDADPSSAQAELDEVNKQLEQVIQDFEVKELEWNKAQDAHSQAEDALDNAESLIAFYEGRTEDLENYRTQLVSLEEDVARYHEKISSLNNELVPFEEELTTQEEAYEPALAEAKNLLEDWIQAESALAAADVNHNAGDAEYDEAKTARDDARTAFEDVAGDYYAAYGLSSPKQIDLEGRPGISGSSFGDIKISYDAIVAEFSHGQAAQLQYDLSQAQRDLAMAQDQVAQMQANAADAEADISVVESDYNEAVANLEELQQATFEAKIASRRIYLEFWELQIERDRLWDLQDNLENYLSGAIADLMESIKNLENEMLSIKEDISDKLAALEDNAISKAEWDAKIAQEEAKLERLKEEYEALLALAADYLEQFNQAVAN